MANEPASPEPPRRVFRQTYWHLWKWFALIAVILIVRIVQTATTPNYRADKRPALRNGGCEIIEILNGNEFLIRLLPLPPEKIPEHQTEPAAERTIHVKLLSVETPDPTTMPDLSEQSKQFSADFLTLGQPRIELDRRRILRDGRGLVFLYVGDRCLNIEIARAGMAYVDIYPGDSRWLEKRLRDAHAEAQQNRIGIWANGDFQPPKDVPPER